MRIYCDPSLLVALYLPESRTISLRRWLLKQRTGIGLNVWQELEFRNSARQKVMRGEANEGDLARTFRIFDDDCIQGRIIRKAVAWETTFEEAERISRKLASSNSCRAFDLLHVAIARTSNLPDFATLDTEQAKLAKTAGLRLVKLPE